MSADNTIEPLPLPAEALDFAAQLYPLFIWSLKQVQLDGPQFFVLSFLRRSSVTDTSGRKSRLHADVTGALTEIGIAKNRISSTLASIKKARRAVRWDLSNRRERQRYFGQTPGQNRALSLTSIGERTLREFTTRINEVVEQLLRSSGRSPQFLNTAVLTFIQNSEALMAAAQALTANSYDKQRRHRRRL